MNELQPTEADENGVVAGIVDEPDTVSALAIARGEVEMQLGAAHRYPRSVKRFIAEATTLATLNEETAQSCIYSVPRGGKNIAGPSVRLAEICVSAWGNSHVAARIVGIDDKDIIAQGAAWDLEKNLRVTVETRRRITNRNGDRFNDDMITVTGNAAASIALRNAIFRIIPKSYVQLVYDAARKVAIGDASTLVDRRAKVMERLQKLGAPIEGVLAAVGKPSVEDIGLDDLEVLVGLGTRCKNGEAKLDDVFPKPRPPAEQPPAEDQGRRMPLKGRPSTPAKDAGSEG